MITAVLNGFVKAVDAATLALSIVGQVGLFIIAPLVTADVIMRGLFHSPIPGVLEIVQALNVIIIFLSIAFVQRLKGHIKIDLVVSHMSPAQLDAFETFCWIVGLAVFSLLTWQMSIFTVESWRVREATMGLIYFPVYPIKFLIAVGSFLLCLGFIIDITRSINRLYRRTRGLPVAEHAATGSGLESILSKF